MGFKKAWTRSYENRIIEYHNAIDKMYKNIEIIKEEERKLIQLMHWEATNLGEGVCKKYIEFGTLKEVAAWLNEKGIKVVREKEGIERKFNTNDVSDFIRMEAKNSSNNMFAEEALKLLKMNGAHF